MATIKILSAQNGEVLQNIDNNIVKLTQNSVIQVNADIDEVGYLYICFFMGILLSLYSMLIPN